MGAVIVDSAVYRQGRRIVDDLPPSELGRVRKLATEPGDFVWVGLHEPNEQELATVEEEFGLHPLAVEDAFTAHQRPKLERYEHTLFLTLKSLWYVDESDAVETGEINMFVGDDFVITVRHGSGSELHSARRDLEAKTTVLTHGPSAVVYAVCDRVVDGYLTVMDALEEDVDEVETSVFSGAAHQRLGPDLHPEAGDRRGEARGPAAARADASLRHRRGPRHRREGGPLLPRRSRPPEPRRRDRRRAGPAPLHGVRRPPGSDLGPAERGHAQDLGRRRASSSYRR